MWMVGQMAICQYMLQKTAIEQWTLKHCDSWNYNIRTGRIGLQITI